MPVKLLMTWVASTKRWAKNYRGKSYSVSCRQLGVPATKEASWQAANEWWAAQEAELDEASRKPVHPLVQLAYNVVTGGGATGLLDQVERGQAARDMIQILEAFSGKTLDDQEIVTLVTEDHRAQYLAGTIPPDLVWKATGGDEETLREMQARLARLLPDTTGPCDRTLGGRVAAWLATFRPAVASGQMEPSRYDAYRRGVTKFSDFLGAGKPDECISWDSVEAFHAHLLSQIAARKKWKKSQKPLKKGESKPGYANRYAHGIFSTVQQFVKWLARRGYITLPANIDTLKIAKEKSKIRIWSPAELKQMLEGCGSIAPRTRLYLLLMLNCGMYQSDISEIGRDEVDLDRGRIERPRSKSPDGPVVTYKLWPETLALLRKFAAPESVCVLNKRDQPRLLLTEKNTPLVISGLREDHGLQRTDNIKSAYVRLVQRLGVEKGPPLKCLRKTSATTFGKHKQFKFYVKYFLAHSPKGPTDESYFIPSNKEFFRALAWLRRRYASFIGVFTDESCDAGTSADRRRD